MSNQDNKKRKISDNANVINHEAHDPDAQEHTHLIVPDDKDRLTRAPYAEPPAGFKAKFTGKCFCEAVTFEISEEPLGESFLSEGSSCDLGLRADGKGFVADTSYCHW